MSSEVSLGAVAVIAAMALVTYATKTAGLWVVDRLDLSEAQRAGLDALPGGVVVAILVPELLEGGPAEWVAAAAVLVVAVRTDRVLPPLAVGVAVVVAARSL